MRRTSIAMLASALVLSSCNHDHAVQSASSVLVNAAMAAQGVSLANYEASHSTPYWNIKLTNGTTISFGYPGATQNYTETLTVTSQTRLNQGKDWVIEASNGNGDITIFIKERACTDDHLGGPFRDTVHVAADLQQINTILMDGCGGPAL